MHPYVQAALHIWWMVTSKRLVLACILLALYISQIISPTTLFLAAKVEEQPRKLEHVIKVAHACLNPQEPPLDTKSNVSLERSVSSMKLFFFSLTLLHVTLSFSLWSWFPFVNLAVPNDLAPSSKQGP